METILTFVIDRPISSASIAIVAAISVKEAADRIIGK